MTGRSNFFKKCVLERRLPCAFCELPYCSSICNAVKDYVREHFGVEMKNYNYEICWEPIEIIVHSGSSSIARSTPNLRYYNAKGETIYYNSSSRGQVDSSSEKIRIYPIRRPALVIKEDYWSDLNGYGVNRKYYIFPDYKVYYNDKKEEKDEQNSPCDTD